MVANDERPLHGCYALYYLLSMERAIRGSWWCAPRWIRIPWSHPSVTPRVPLAWSEREAFDMFGLRAIGLPDERRLVLPDDWPNDLYPLRKDSMDYRKRPAPVTDVENYSFLYEGHAEETTEVPSPLHITSDEPGTSACSWKGRTSLMRTTGCSTCTAAWRKWPSRLNYDAVTFLADRICGHLRQRPFGGLCRAVEHAQGIEVPVRAQYIRSILLEVERLHSHLLNLGLVCHYCGFDTGFQHFFRVREDHGLGRAAHRRSQDLRLNLIGGVRRDILDEQARHDQVRAGAAARGGGAGGHTRVHGQLRIAHGRHPEGSTRRWPATLSPVGPCVRGSGIARDVRFDHPFDGYKFLVGMSRGHDGCDAEPTLVRVEEFMDSPRYDRATARRCAGRPHQAENWQYTPHKFALGYTEAPRGEDMHWAQVGDNQSAIAGAPRRPRTRTGRSCAHVPRQHRGRRRYNRGLHGSVLFLH